MLLLSAGCGGKGEDTGKTVVAVGPELSHEPGTASLQEGDSLTVEVGASDPDGVASVVMYHRTAETEYWDTLSLENADGTWSGTLDTVYAPGLEYYFKAKDSSAGGAESYLPVEATSAPFLVEVRPVGASLPYLEGFESDAEEASLFQLDWWTPSDAYDAYVWQLTSGNAYAGEQAALHGRGNDGVSELQDWLISPAIDLSTVDGVMVTWWELGRTTEKMEEHGLYVSTGSRLPEDGDFVAVEAALPAPTEGAWGRSAAYDLSAWAGEPVVYLGWFYRGSYADDWYMDEVFVRELAPDLDVDLVWAPDPVYAGESSTLTLTVDNLTVAPASSLTGTLSLPEGGGTLEGDGAVDFGAVAGEGTASVDVGFEIDASTPNSSYLPLTLELSDGSESWAFDLDMVIGLPSTAEIDLSLDATALVRVEVGTGDPDSPDLKVSVAAESLDAGSHTLTADLTEYWELLPTGPGPSRWWAKVNTSADGSIDAFAITYDGETELATGAPKVLSSTDGEDSYLIYLPEPPVPQLSSVNPSQVDPGDVFTPVFSVVNIGYDTAGPVTATVSSADPDVSVGSGETFSLSSSVWSSGATLSGSGPQVSLSGDHVDSTPIHLDLLLDDGVESWVIEVPIEVPWPVLRVFEIRIDDEGGDGVLDAGESATLEVTIANTGSMNTFGPVYGSASVASTSTASATINGDSTYFGSINIGKTRDAEFDIQVSGGSTGDTVDLEFSFTDGTESYVTTTQLVLGEPPWQMLSTTDDPVGDAIDAYGFDFVNGAYRINGDTAELWLTSDVAFDQETLFIEIWGSSSGTPYSWYRWVVQSGNADLQGYSGGFTTIGAAEVDYIGPKDLILRWSLADMDLAVSSINMGLAAGWCGPPEYFCDHFPDNWGYPYDTFSTSSWYSLSW